MTEFINRMNELATLKNDLNNKLKQFSLGKKPNSKYTIIGIRNELKLINEYIDSAIELTPSEWCKLYD